MSNIGNPGRHQRDPRLDPWLRPLRRTGPTFFLARTVPGRRSAMAMFRLRFSGHVCLDGFAPRSGMKAATNDEVPRHPSPRRWACSCRAGRRTGSECGNGRQLLASSDGSADIHICDLRRAMIASTCPTHPNPADWVEAVDLMGSQAGCWSQAHQRPPGDRRGQSRATPRRTGPGRLHSLPCRRDPVERNVQSPRRSVGTTASTRLNTPGSRRCQLSTTPGHHQHRSTSCEPAPGAAPACRPSRLSIPGMTEARAELRTR